VASHYISDSFSAPHCMLKSGAYHSLYELQGGLISPHVTVTNGDFKNMMENAKLNGQYSWNSWMMDRNNCYIQSDLDNATTASYLAIKQHLN
jgi:hypothetical protein